jgi:predicted Zn-dependent protease
VAVFLSGPCGLTAVNAGRKVSADSLAGLDRALADDKRWKRTIVLCLAVLPAEREEIHVVKGHAAVILNLAVLGHRREDDGESESFLRRVEKESVRAVGMALGMPPCPFPRCALLPHINEATLDMKARTPCPPCMQKLQTLLRERTDARK